MMSSGKRKLNPSQIIEQLVKSHYETERKQDPSWTYEQSLQFIAQTFPALYARHLEHVKAGSRALL